MEPHSSFTISHVSAGAQSPQHPLSQQQLSGQQQSATDVAGAAGATGDCIATNASSALVSSTENFARIIEILLPELVFM